MGEEEGEICTLFWMLSPSSAGDLQPWRQQNWRPLETWGGEEPISLVGSRRGAFPWVGSGGQWDNLW